MATATKNETKKWGPTVGGQKRVAIITGGNSGLGFECAKQMLGQGYRVVLACRNPAKAKQAVQQLRAGNTSADVDSAILDVSSLRSVTAFADGWLATSSKVCACTTHSLTHSLTHLLTHSLTHQLPHSFTHLLAPSFIHYLTN